ncbi:MAG: hypothetical protein QOJ59_2052, partial [Thermomicrobiales bacterium]|nr:hypothetical protein [Thermomicrobiales bacterium]
MSGRGTEITLRVEQASAGGKPGWRYRVFVNGETVGQERTVDPRTAVQIRDFGRRYAQLFETKYQPAVKRQTLESLGDDLFQTWFAADWQVITARGATGPRRIVLASDDATILNLPWELTRPANGAVFGADPNVSLRRTPQAVS